MEKPVFEALSAEEGARRSGLILGRLLDHEMDFKDLPVHWNDTDAWDTLNKKLNLPKECIEMLQVYTWGVEKGKLRTSKLNFTASLEDSFHVSGKSPPFTIVRANKSEECSPGGQFASVLQLGSNIIHIIYVHSGASRWSFGS